MLGLPDLRNYGLINMTVVPDKVSFDGINAHADFAAINVNFWITPRSANLNKSSGGLVAITPRL